MNIYPIPAFADNYIWAIIDKELGVFDCVDPGDAKPVLLFAQINGLTLRTILLTHHHSDHVGGVSELVNAFPSCLVYGPDDKRIPDMATPVHQHQIIKVGDNNFTVLFNPGHTATHISYYEANKGWLFCGDTLFSGGCGRVFDGTIEELHQSLLLFKNLPLATKIFCAHEYTLQNLKFARSVEPANAEIQKYMQQLAQHNVPLCSLPSTIELECAINPFLRTEIKEVIEYAQRHGSEGTKSLDVFKVLRKQKNLFK